MIGGVSFEDQFRKLDRGADILIATPGRLLDCFERGKILMNGVEVLVIDEADRMLDMGFIPDIERICKMVPFTRQTLFFSATMAPEIERLAGQFLQNPGSGFPFPQLHPLPTRLPSTPVVSSHEDFEKRATLRNLIDNAENLTNAIIFCNRKRDVATVFKSLDKHGYSCGALHGDMDQRSRTTMLHNFRENNITLLVASDVAARGLDIPNVSHIFNFDVPVNAEDYVHRIGRTARAGREGTAYMIVTPVDQKGFDAIESLIKQKIDWQGDAVEWDARAGRRGRGKPASKSTSKPAAKSKPAKNSKPEAKAEAAPRAAKKPNEFAKKSRAPKDEHHKNVVQSDKEHAFGGEEHIPAFLR